MTTYIEANRAAHTVATLYSDYNTGINTINVVCDCDGNYYVLVGLDCQCNYDIPTMIDGIYIKIKVTGPIKPLI